MAKLVYLAIFSIISKLSARERNRRPHKSRPDPPHNHFRVEAPPSRARLIRGSEQSAEARSQSEFLQRPRLPVTRTVGKWERMTELALRTACFFKDTDSAPGIQSPISPRPLTYQRHEARLNLEGKYRSKWERRGQARAIWKKWSTSSSTSLARKVATTR